MLCVSSNVKPKQEDGETHPPGPESIDDEGKSDNDAEKKVRIPESWLQDRQYYILIVRITHSLSRLHGLIKLWEAQLAEAMSCNMQGDWHVGEGEVGGAK